MSTSDLKLNIFRKIDSLDEKQLTEIYGLLKNLIHGNYELNDWDELSEYQKNGIVNALDQIESGKGIPNEQVISKFRKKYTDV
ncbi:MAG: hypothetical protein KAS71_15960 [Bacteroidales bacterium]|nr:hypothetical protein [Bacteroidales bacterium]